MKAQKQSSMQAGSCRLSAILTTNAHMLKPQHIFPLVLMLLELQPALGLGVGAIVHAVPALSELFTMNCCIKKVSHLEIPVSDVFH